MLRRPMGAAMYKGNVYSFNLRGGRTDEHTPSNLPSRCLDWQQTPRSETPAWSEVELLRRQQPLLLVSPFWQRGFFALGCLVFSQLDHQSWEAFCLNKGIFCFFLQYRLVQLASSQGSLPCREPCLKNLSKLKVIADWLSTAPLQCNAFVFVFVFLSVIVFVFYLSLSLQIFSGHFESTTVSGKLVVSRPLPVSLYLSLSLCLCLCPCNFFRAF